MYALAGIISKNGENVAEHMVSMMREHCGNENYYSGLMVGDKTFNGKLNDLNIKAIEGSIGLCCVPLKKTHHASIYRDGSSGLTVVYDGIIYNYKRKLSRDYKLISTTDVDIIRHLLKEEDYKRNLVFAAKNILGNVEGGFAIAATNGNDIIAARDPVGFRTIYYGENDDFYAFATLKKALWKVGIPKVLRLYAGNMIHINKKQLGVLKISQEEKFGVKINIKDTPVAVSHYQESLSSAVEKMLGGLDKAGILLSGGVDSCLLAKVLKDRASELGVELTGYTIGLEGSHDLKYAEEFAKQIGLPLRMKTVTVNDLDKALPKVIKTVEERDHVQIETSLIPFIAMKMASQDSQKVVFLGQGPDELWGGYPWYPHLLKEWGYAKLHEMLWEDLIRGDVETLARENKVAQIFGIELRYPYLDIDVIKTAMSVAPQLKVLSNKDDLGKRIHRILAKKLGVPTATAERKKIAAQHGSGIHEILMQIAQKHGFNNALVNDLNYSSSKITIEKLGSSSRYGYKYVSKDKWVIPNCIQLYFDYLAYKAGLLNENERTKISSVFGNHRFNVDAEQLVKVHDI
ncbi:MAG: asparagine synthetase B [archaeon]|nr:asparagine synthetase B [archaeon]